MRFFACALAILVAGCGGSPSVTDEDAGTPDSAVVVPGDAAQSMPVDGAAAQDGGLITNDMATPHASPPPGAASAGYSSNVFDDEFTTLDTIDLQNTQAAGFNWYVAGDWFSVTPKSALSIVNVGGVSALSLDGSGNYQILGAIAKNGKPIGHSFSDGAYFEARIAMSMPDDQAKSWPAFWGLPNLGGNSEHWNGNPNDAYVNSVELDIMELMPHSETGSPLDAIHSTLHDWFATNHSQVPASYTLPDSSTVKIESTKTAAVFNTIGASWVPSVKGSQGYVQFYFNDTPFGSPITWVGTPPTTAAASNNWTPTKSAATTPWTFGALDLFPQSLILSNGGNAFMYVQWVRVWQKP